MGKLGIIVRVKFHIVKETPVRRVLRAITPVDWLNMVKQAQAAYTANGTLLPWLNETQIFWVTQKNVVSYCSVIRWAREACYCQSTCSYVSASASIEPSASARYVHLARRHAAKDCMLLAVEVAEWSCSTLGNSVLQVYPVALKAFVSYQAAVPAVSKMWHHIMEVEFVRITALLAALERCSVGALPAAAAVAVHGGLF